MHNSIQYQFTTFLVMVLIGMMFNPMNILAFRISDLYVSYTLFYGGLLMASNMIWAHEMIHLIMFGSFSSIVFIIGILLSVSISIFLLRNQFLVNDTQWLKRMISHHSTALTTSHNIYKKTNNPAVKKLAKDIIQVQEKEIQQMKQMIHTNSNI